MNLQFAWPLAFALLGFLPLLAFVDLRPSRRAPALRLSSAPRAGALPATWRVRLRWAPAALRLLALALLVVAVARPQAGRADALVPQEGIDAVLVLDTSASMRAPVAGEEPRLAVAQRVLRDFAATRERDRLGLVAFRARSYVLSPLTLDYGAFQELIDRADELDLRDGTGLGLAVADALNLLRESDARSRVVIVATDGENNQPEVGPLGAARIAEALGVRVYTIGIFSKQAEPPPGVPAGAGEPALRAMAERTDGRYFRAGDPATLARVYDAIDGLERSRVGDERYTAFDELAPYFLAGALAALAAQVLLTTFVLRRLP